MEPTIKNIMPPQAQKRRYRDDTESDMDEFVANMPTLDQSELDLLKQIGKGPYSSELEKLETSITRLANTIKTNSGLEDLDCGLAPPSQWDIEGDAAIVRNFMALQIATITNILGYDNTVITPTGVAPQQGGPASSHDPGAALQEAASKIPRPLTLTHPPPLICTRLTEATWGFLSSFRPVKAVWGHTACVACMHRSFWAPQLRCQQR